MTVNQTFFNGIKPKWKLRVNQTTFVKTNENNEGESFFGYFDPNFQLFLLFEFLKLLVDGESMF
jgi:hypothetical protein